MLLTWCPFSLSVEDMSYEQFRERHSRQVHKLASSSKPSWTLDIIPMLSAISPGSENAFKKISHKGLSNCPKSIQKPLNQYEKYDTSAVFFYRYEPELDPPILVQMTGYHIRTSCRQYWLTSNREEVLSDDPIPTSLLDQEKLNLFKATMKSAINTFKIGASGTELFGEEMFDCQKFSWSSNIKELKVVKWKTLIPHWSSKGHLIEPFLSHQCKSHDPHGECSPVPSTIFFWTPNSTKSSCSLSRIQNLAGVISWDSTDNRNPKLNKFFNPEARFDIRFSGVSVMDLVPECFKDDGFVFPTPEGHLIQFAPHNGYPVFITDGKSWTEQMIKNGGLESPSIRRRARRASFQHHSLSNPWIPPILPSPIITNNANRSKRGVTDWPLEFRDIWMAEHNAWTASELEGQIAYFKNKTFQELTELHYLICENTMSILRVTETLLPISERPFLEVYLGRRSFLSKLIRGEIFVNLGTPVKTLTLPQQNNWCNGHLEVNYTNAGGDVGTGWLTPDIGLILPTLEPCKTTTSPSFFLLPILKYGSFEIISGQVYKNPFYHGPNETLSGSDLGLSAPAFSPLDPNFRWKLYESSLSGLNQPKGGAFNSDTLFKSDGEFKIEDFFQTVLGKLISGITIVLIGHMLLSMVLSCIGGDRRIMARM